MKIYIAFLLLGFLAFCAAEKEGLAWADWDTSNLGALAGNGLKPTWIYTWSPWNINQREGLEFIPMFHDPGSATDFVNAYNAGVWSGSSAILGLNEPDMNGVSAGQAVQLWNQYMQPHSNFRLGAPAVASDPQGKEWLQDFMNQCGGCKIDFIPLHWYGSDWTAFTAYVEDMHNTFGKNIWITEWACVQYGNSPPCDQQSVYNFMGATTQWLDQQGYVERWSWFGAMKSLPNGIPATNGLLTSDGQSRTGLGNQYSVVGGHA
eukprot:Phypoly_transcript_14576.p1 GENE.Phypoly_transcript_14576~~Phypoly_transcript_14576.p1  ORF type:complete len:262 (+),score=27.02 Phypoly_transcript_14576:123-908(+)